MAGETINLTQEEKEVYRAACILMSIREPQYRKHLPEEDVLDDEVTSTPLLQVSQAHQKLSRKRKDADENQPKKIKKQNMMKIMKQIYFSEETRRLIELWYKTEPDPRTIFGDVEVTRQFSKPLKKQLMLSDVKKDQSRLMLPKQQVEETMLPFLEESENPSEGFDVSVYGPDGTFQGMKFKIWNGDKTPVLTSGWKEFVEKYDLTMVSDFITIWMFRHIVGNKICFAIDFNRFPLKNN